MRSVLNWLRDEYGDEVELVVTENGFSDQQGNLDDPQRIYYYKHYINQVLKGSLLKVEKKIIDGSNERLLSSLEKRSSLTAST